MTTEVVLVFFLFSTLPVLSSAGFLVGKGATGSLFLNIPMGARAAALGSAFTAVRGDVTAIEYNPAGLIGNDRLDTNLTHTVYIEGTYLDSVAFSYPFQFNSLTKSESLQQFEKGKFVAAGQYRLFQASDEQRNAVGAKQGSFQIRDDLFQVALAYSAASSLSLGFSGKFIRNKIVDEGSSKYAFDAGLNFRPSPEWSFGASLLNMGQDKAILTDPDPLPTTLRFGAGYDTKKFLCLADYAQGRDKISQESVGLEFKAARLVKIRAGVFYHTSVEFSGGLGIRFSDSESLPPPTQEQPSRTLGGIDQSQRYKLGGAESSSHNLRKAAPSSFKQKSGIDFGLDYAARTNNELGITHTITVKILY